MLTLHAPEYREEGGRAIVSARFTCDGQDRALWFATDAAHGEYLCHERADAFLVVLLLYGMSHGQDVHVAAPVSDRLLYTLPTYLIPPMHRMAPELLAQVNLTCDQPAAGTLPNAGAVGTGLSCGIDSFFTIAHHSREGVPPGHRITHLAYHNVGAHTREDGDSETLFRERQGRIRAFAAEYGYPLVTVDSNVDEILDRFSFIQTHTFRNAAAALALQKLYRTYYYSSSATIYQFGFELGHPSFYEPYSLHMIGSNTLSFFCSGTTHTRVEKTKVVADYAPSYHYLNVCVTESENCSTCFKCLRTLITLDIMGKVDRYAGVFDLEKYRRVKAQALSDILSEPEDDLFGRDIRKAIADYGYDVPQEVLMRAKYQRTKKHLAKNATLRAWYHALRGRK